MQTPFRPGALQSPAFTATLSKAATTEEKTMRTDCTRNGGALLAAPLALALALLGSTPALAQTAPDPVEALLQAADEDHDRAPDARQDPEAVRVTRALNDEIAARDALAENQERADREAADAAQASYEREMAAADANRARYEEDLRAAEEARRRYDLEIADWRATVEACRRGDRARCAAGSIPARAPALD